MEQRKKMKKNFLVTVVLSAAIGAAVAAWVSIREAPRHESASTYALPLHLSSQAESAAGTVDLTAAAEKTVHAVVHVKTSFMRSVAQQNVPDIFEFFYGFRGYRQEQQPVQGAGSGVLLSEDGYIVTNNHVVAQAEEIQVTLNDKRSFTAKLVGTDPSTDIAVIKIEATSLPYVSFGNSDALRLGEWVLAVGNPLNLTSTVTAGIVSAKARNINILSDSYKIESFIQTDAAVNPGNSGGALVNTRGELMGINTAIASPTGSFAGYSFAVPSSIAKKVVTDIIEFGVVQRAMLGVGLQELTSEVAAEHHITEMKGVLIGNVQNSGAAEQAGVREGDVILKVNDVEVNTVAQLQEQISKFRPNDQVSLTVNRSNKIMHINVVLRNRAGTTDVVKPDDLSSLSLLGVTLKEVDSRTKRSLRIANGVQVVELKQGKLQQQGVKKGYIIVRINRTPVNSASDVSKALAGVSSSEAVLVEGVYPNGMVAYYAIGM
jgi:Do/DeqQ family serine protease